MTRAQLAWSGLDPSRLVLAGCFGGGLDSRMPIARSGATALRIGAWSAYASGAVAAIGVPLLIGMYGVFFRSGPKDPLVERLGGASDAMVLAQYALALPLAVALHQRNRSTNPRLSGAATTVGVSAMCRAHRPP
jgi:hypothetical protein